MSICNIQGSYFIFDLMALKKLHNILGAPHQLYKYSKVQFNSDGESGVVK